MNKLCRFVILAAALLAGPVHATVTGSNASIVSGWTTGQAGWGVSMNTNLRTIDSLLAVGVVHVRAYGAKGDGVTNDLAACQAAINAASPGQSVYFARGTYLVLGLEGKNGVNLIGDGATLKKNGGGLATHILNMTGSTTATTENLTVNAAIGDVVLTMASSSGFAAGDYVLVRDATYKYGSGPQARNQELNRIETLTGTTITLRNRLIGSYATASTAEILKLNPMANILVRGLNFEVNVGSNTGGAFYGTLCYGIRVEDCTALYPNDDAGFYFDKSAHCEVINCTVRDGQNAGTSSYGYGVIFADCQFCVGRGNHTENVRENTITDNSRACGFIGCVDHGAVDDSYNTHGAGNVGCYIIGCLSVSSKLSGIAVGQSSLNAADTDGAIIGNVILNPRGNGISINASASIRNARWVVANNVVRNFGSADLAQFGIFIGESDYINVTGNAVSGGTSNASYGIRLDGATYANVVGNGVSSISNGYGVGIIDGAAPPAHVVVRHNQFNGISSSNVRNTSTATVGIIVGPNDADDATYTLLATDMATANAPSQAVAYAASITVNAMAGETVNVGTLTGNLTVNAPTNPTTGAWLRFNFLQDGTGGRTVAFNAAFKTGWVDTGNTANKRSSVAFVYDGTNWVQNGAQAGYY